MASDYSDNERDHNDAQEFASFIANLTLVPGRESVASELEGTSP
jgi:hypothetical protein